MIKDVQKLIGPYKQFIMHPINTNLSSKIYLFVPGFGQNGSGLCYLYSELYKYIKNNKIGFPILFDYVNEGDSNPQKVKINDSIEDYFNDVLFILEVIKLYHPKNVNIILSGMSMLFFKKILNYDDRLKIILIPPYPMKLIRDNALNKIENNMQKKEFFESLGASFSSWKGTMIQKRFLEDLYSETNDFCKSEAIKESNMSFDFYDMNISNCIKLSHEESITIIHPDDRRLIMENLK